MINILLSAFKCNPNTDSSFLGIDKQTQELYGLINYGEIWKKLGFKTDSKIKHNLNELVNSGYAIRR